MIFSESDLQDLISIGPWDLTWGLFQSIEPGDHYEWFLYDRNVSMTIAGLPLHSVLSGRHSNKESALEQAKSVFQMAEKFFEAGTYWNLLEGLPEPEPEPEPEPTPEPEVTEEEVNEVIDTPSLQGLPWDEEEEETLPLPLPEAKGFWRRGRAQPYDVH